MKSTGKNLLYFYTLAMNIQKENELKKKSIYYSKQWSKILRNKGSTQLVCTKHETLVSKLKT